ncbi:hypothetical protein CRYUN_Cryun22dG0011500 [Craigia yunnanensis]
MNDIGIVTDNDVLVSGFAFEVDGFKYMLLLSFSLLLLLVSSNVNEDEDGPSDGVSWKVAMVLNRKSLQHFWPRMKKEACKHGMLRTYRVLPSPWNPEPETRSVQRLNSPPATGFFSNVPSKSSNHSKFTWKCGRPQCLECHLNPVSKSKNKTKGYQKFRTSNMIVSPRLITWRVVDKRPGLNFSGFSATGMLEYLYSVNEDDENGDHVNDDHDDYDDGGPCGLLDDHDDYMANFWSLHEKENERGVKIEEYVDDDDKMDSNYDDAMSFCDVGFMLDQTEEDEGWCLLREM